MIWVQRVLLLIGVAFLIASYITWRKVIEVYPYQAQYLSVLRFIVTIVIGCLFFSLMQFADMVSIYYFGIILLIALLCWLYCLLTKWEYKVDYEKKENKLLRFVSNQQRNLFFLIIIVIFINISYEEKTIIDTLKSTVSWKIIRNFSILWLFYIIIFWRSYFLINPPPKETWQNLPFAYKLFLCIMIPDVSLRKGVKTQND